MPNDTRLRAEGPQHPRIGRALLRDIGIEPVEEPLAGWVVLSERLGHRAARVGVLAIKVPAALRHDDRRRQTDLRTEDLILVERAKRVFVATNCQHRFAPDNELRRWQDG